MNNTVSVSENPLGEGTPCTCLYGDVLWVEPLESWPIPSIPLGIDTFYDEV